MKHADIVNRMTAEEKAAFLSGKSEWESWNFERLGIPSIFMSDGPSGIRKQAGEGDHLGLNPSVPATCFPSSATLCNSWDAALTEEVGEGLGREAMAEGVNVLLGPGMNIKRNPLCGRNFEYFSEDPYLTGKLAAAEVRGIQSRGVAACCKHFAVNSQETRRMAMNAVIDERTLREIYLTAFEIAVKESHPRAMMSSYNEVNGVYANENRHLLTDILRKEWGFDGFVVTDWGASNDHVLGVKNGSNLEMPNPGLDSARELLAGVKSGRISQDEVDQRVDELLDVVLELTAEAKKVRQNHDDHDGSVQASCLDKDAIHRENHQLARRAAAESMVLLKNEDRILPLKSGTRVAIIGDFAFEPRYQGAGSSMVNATKVENIRDLAGGYDLQVVGTARGYRRDGSEDATLIGEAVSLAKQADVVLLFFGLNEQSESEGLDRTHLRIPQNQITLMREIQEANRNTVGIISAGSVIEMPWHSLFKGLLHAYLPGQAGASAMLDVLTGAVNPSGHLGETILNKYEDTPSYSYYPALERNSEYRESVFVGYRYFETADVPVLFPFGYGLSYTTFEYSALQVEESGIRFTLKNTGTRDGAEVVQMYVGMKDSALFRPVRELKGFAKIFLKVGEEKKVSIPFDDKTFRVRNRMTDRWEIEGGTYQISVGSSCRDLRLFASVEKQGDLEQLPYDREKCGCYYKADIRRVSDEAYEEILGYPVPSGSWNQKSLGINDALCQMYYAKSPIARKIYRVLDRKLKKSQAEGGVPDLNTMFQYNMPFRAIAKMTGGLVSMEMVKSIVEMVNGHFFRGMGGVIGGFFRNRKENKQYLRKLN
ncbi:glycoside hydrolase family 3 C-terminal domain-containing protein [Bilifractor sp. LCP21S3_A7]|uniref:glycoside hydrolase family 3 C-terminal domain-containing protein n=1 Tax=Bilifractor sp. LCP21S3_A7 TaxID=3438738 RepID=UPI003F90AD52